MINGPNQESLIPLSIQSLTLIKKPQETSDKILLKSEQMASFLIDQTKKNVLIPFSISVILLNKQKTNALGGTKSFQK
jgi:hypothetical protein